MSTDEGSGFKLWILGLRFRIYIYIYIYIGRTVRLWVEGSGFYDPGLASRAGIGLRVYKGLKFVKNQNPNTKQLATQKYITVV